MPAGRNNPDDESPRHRFYGRRTGRKLRPAQQRLIDELLPRLSVDANTDFSNPAALFDVPVSAVWMEIGFGAGEHLEAQARANPEAGLLACEPYINGVASLLSRIEDAPPKNLRLHMGDARYIIDALPDGALDRLFVLFPDPWPKTRQNKRRIFGIETLPHFARVLAPGAELRAATDDMSYAAWMLEHARAVPELTWRARGPGDWRHPPVDWVPTRYEQKAIEAGSRCVYFTFTKN